MHNIVMTKITLTAEYQRISGESLVASVEISCPPTNAGSATFKAASGDEVPWVPGEYHAFRAIDLYDVQVKGTPGDTVTVIGGTW